MASRSSPGGISDGQPLPPAPRSKTPPTEPLPLPMQPRPSYALVSAGGPLQELAAEPRHSLNPVELQTDPRPVVEGDKMGGAALTESVTDLHPPPRTSTWASSDTFVSAPPLGHSLAAGGPPAPGTDSVTLFRRQRGYEVRPRPRLAHNLNFVMGFMEMANAWDFAANVWNTEPVPAFATALMAIGGTVAGVFSLFTLRDAFLAWHNVNFLRQQRLDLLDARARSLWASPTASVLDIDALLEVGHRELLTEFVCRFILDLFMGFGAILISVGTYMAIGGKHHTVYVISNLLSGYVGNTPVALVAICVAIWALLLWRKAQSHLDAVREMLPGTRAAERVRRRTRNVQIWCLVNGLTTIVGSVGSMITATRWWGYVMLLPVTFSAVFCNIWWRARVGYARHDHVVTAMRSVSGGGAGAVNVVDELSTALELAARAAMSVRQRRGAPLEGLVADPMSLRQVVHFLAEQDLFEVYCLRLAKDAELRAAICGSLGLDADADELILDAASLCKLPEAVHGPAIAEAEALLRKDGSEHFQFRERYAAELLGSYTYLLKTTTTTTTSTNNGRGHGEENGK